MSEFFKKVRWWELEPHPELVEGYPGKYCSAVPGKEYVVYLRYGGPVKINLGDASPDSRFNVKWFNPRIGKYEKTGTIAGGEIVRLNAPDRNDWVLHICADKSE